MKNLLCTSLCVLSLLSTSATLSMEMQDAPADHLKTRQNLSERIDEALTHFLSFSRNEALTPDAYVSTTFGCYYSDTRVREQEEARHTWKTLEAHRDALDAHEKMEKARQAELEAVAHLDSLMVLEANHASRLEAAKTALRHTREVYKTASIRLDFAERNLGSAKDELNKLKLWKFDEQNARTAAEADAHVPELRAAYEAAIQALQEPESRRTQLNRDFATTVGLVNLEVHKQMVSLENTILSPLKKAKEEARQHHSDAQYGAFCVVDKARERAQSDHTKRVKDCSADVQRHQVEMDLALIESCLQLNNFYLAQSEVQKESCFPEALARAQATVEEAVKLAKLCAQTLRIADQNLKELEGNREEKILDQIRLNAAFRLDILIKQRNWTKDRYQLRMTEDDRAEAQRWARALKFYDRVLDSQTDFWGVDKAQAARYLNDKNNRAYLEVLG